MRQMIPLFEPGSLDADAAVPKRFAARRNTLLRRHSLQATPSVIASRTRSLVRVTPSFALMWLHLLATVL